MTARSNVLWASRVDGDARGSAVIGARQRKLCDCRHVWMLPAPARPINDAFVVKLVEFDVDAVITKSPRKLQN